MYGTVCMSIFVFMYMCVYLRLSLSLCICVCMAIASVSSLPLKVCLHHNLKSSLTRPLPSQSVRDSEISDKAKIKMKSSVTLNNEEDSLKIIFQSLEDSQVEVESLMSALRYVDEKYGCTTISIPSSASASASASASDLSSTYTVSSSVNSESPVTKGNTFGCTNTSPSSCILPVQHLYLTAKVLSKAILLYFTLRCYESTIKKIIAASTRGV